MKAKQLGLTVFEYPQEVSTECIVTGVTHRSAAGTNITYESSIQAPYITLISDADDWLSETDKDAIMTMCGQINTTFTLTYEDDTTDTVRFDHSKELMLEEIADGVCFYYGTIYLMKEPV